MAVATARVHAPMSAGIRGVRVTLRLAMMLIGVAAGVRLALPVSDVAAQCPAAAEQGHLGCVLNKAWLPAVFKGLLGVVAGHAAASLVLDRVFRTGPDRRQQAAARAARRPRAAAPTMCPRAGSIAAANERRGAPRTPIALRVEVHRSAAGKPVADVLTVDASLTGLLIADPMPVRVDESLWLTIHLSPVAQLEIAARVARRTRQGEIGVALEGLSPTDRARLATRLAAGG